MFLLRLAGGACFLIAAISLVHDITVTLAGARGFLVTPLFQHWSELSPATLEAARAGLRVKLGMPFLWDSVAASILSFPGWVVFGVLGAVLGFIGRERKRINVFAN